MIDLVELLGCRVIKPYADTIAQMLRTARYLQLNGNGAYGDGSYAQGSYYYPN